MQARNDRGMPKEKYNHNVRTRLQITTTHMNRACRASKIKESGVYIYMNWASCYACLRDKLQLKKRSEILEVSKEEKKSSNRS